MTSDGKDDIGTWVALAAFDLAAITSIDARLPREASLRTCGPSVAGIK